jgi:hypothetical protein
VICTPAAVAAVGVVAVRSIGKAGALVLTAWFAEEPLSSPHAASDALITTAAAIEAAVPQKPTLIIPRHPV